MAQIKTLDWPLMRNNVAPEDVQALIDYLSANRDDPVVTQSAQVRRFEEEWSEWLGVQYSVFVNSGSSANLITIAALRELYGSGGEIICPTITWVSDIAAVLHAGFRPVFVDIDPRTLGMDNRAAIAAIGSETRAVFLTHVLGYNALSESLLEACRSRGIPLIEDTCESYGATFQGKKLGTFGWASNFSFYYAHHLTTGEGGMVSTDDPELYQVLRMFRAHGLVREADSSEFRRRYVERHPDLSPDFIFAFPAYNVRSTELNAVLGRSQLRRLDEQNARRRENLRLFLDHLDPQKYRTDFAVEGSCNYALTLILRHPDDLLCRRVIETLRRYRVEFRRGTSGGGNQLRQPYLRKLFGELYREFPETEHVHFYGFYIGNYPTLEKWKILQLCELLNALKGEND